MWHFIISVDVIPKDRDLLLAVMDRDGLHMLEFPCRCDETGCWIDVRTGQAIDVQPTHWREWLE